MVYLAHVSEDGRPQTVKEHLEGTAALAAAFARTFGAEDQGRLVGLLHDLGKYTRGFQRRLLEDGARVDHATAGAFACYQAGQVPAAFAIAGHHGGLPDLGTSGDGLEEGTLIARLKRAAEGRLEDCGDGWREIRMPAAALPGHLGRRAETDAFFIRMLFSCLVDADYLDTERFMAGARERLSWSMEALRQRLDAYTADWYPPRNALNERRCAILTACRQRGREERPGLFTLTVPTGGGKTVASLAFALEQAARHGMDRVVYVVPYTSIIEQTADTFRTILGDRYVLEHHSGVTYDVGDQATAESIRKAKATEDWDMPVIVTTAVQFFESLYSNRPSRCRKLHALANSVIVFDEAQMLPLPYLRPCVHAIAELVAHYGATAVLCTATQPALNGLFRDYLSEAPRELCPEALSADPIFRRVRFERAGTLSWDALCAQLNGAEQVLCIVNSRKSAQEVYARLEGAGRFHLSTLMHPQHRRAVLAEVRRRLRAGLPCRVVSTSLIEAGVDVDFPLVFREEAGLDSILQAAGRCNREGKRPAEESVVTLFRAEAPLPPLFATAHAAAEVVLCAQEDFASEAAIRQYFTELLDLKGRAALDVHRLLARLEEGTFPFRTIAEEFRLIESDTRTVYVLGEGQAALLARLERGERSRALFRALAQYGVALYPQHFQTLDRAGALTVLDEAAAVLADLRLYSEETGLSLEADQGRALFV